ncbi:hypothetical protein [Methylophilus sp. 14]|uniref:hypothetical protein n=1 Tax=Methylophilus sp. 14 TaxID=2781019 RepID=UPI00188EB102|nr:hypothetical protein [Methylophilus sp. 14]MBF4988342.1 hypothetical protein [Methylophilus sp. 14]
MQNISNRGWYLYFFVYLLLFISLSIFTIYKGQDLSIISLSLDVLALIGLYKFARTNTVSFSFIWVIIASFFTARLLFVWYILIPNIYPWLSMFEQMVSLWGLVGSAFQVPVAYALWRYSFRKEQNA